MPKDVSHRASSRTSQVGSIIPPVEDAKELLTAGVARVYTPKDYEIQDIMGDLVDIAAAGYDRARDGIGLPVRAPARTRMTGRRAERGP